MELLLSPEDRGYPFEYLLSRIRGRRSRLIKEWRPLAVAANPFDLLSSGTYGRIIKEGSPEAIWRNLVREYRWVYVQMNGPLREMFRPFFLYSELKTLFICLRHGNEKKAGSVDELLGVSLLSDPVKEMLLTSVDIGSAVSGIEREFVSYDRQFSGFREVFERAGLRGVEQRLTNTYLTIVMQERLHPLIRTLFMKLIDSRNIMSTYKYLRLESKAPPSFIMGGSVSVEQLREIAAGKDLFSMASLVSSLTGMDRETFSPTELETALYRGITRFLKKAGRDPLSAGAVLDYLWQCSIEAMNLSTLYYGRELDREALAAELVQ